MQQILTIPELIERGSRIGLRPSDLADLAGVARSTVSLGRRGKIADHQMRTLKKLTRALISREQSLLAYLAELHGAPASNCETSEQEAAE